LILDEKSRLRKHIPTFVLKLSLIAGKTSCLQYLQQMMKLLIQLTGDQVCVYILYVALLNILQACITSLIISTIMIPHLFYLAYFKLDTLLPLKDLKAK
jgi:hypothetical protein